MIRRAAAVLLVLLTTSPSLLVGSAVAAPVQTGGELVGTFAFTPGSCAGGVSGSYLRMILPTGTPAGPFLDNADSTCSDKSHTLLAPGTDGGLVTGGYQPAPDPAYDADGNSLAARVNEPVGFFGVAFSISTNAEDLQSGQPTPAPTLRSDGGKVSGDLSAVVATWNKQAFNQGSPKPDGSHPGNTTPVSGTFDAATGRFSVNWTSQIVGGAFNDFTGLWHLEGTFHPAGTSAPSNAGDPTPTPGAAPGVDRAPVSRIGGAAASPASPAAAADAGGAATTVAPSSEEAAPEVTGQVVASREEAREGWRAPTWLIAITATAGVIAAVVLVRPMRRAPQAAS